MSEWYFRDGAMPCWVNAGAAMPDNGVPVITAHAPTSAIAIAYLHESQWWLTQSGRGLRLSPEPTHWMPLPDPPMLDDPSMHIRRA